MYTQISWGRILTPIPIRAIGIGGLTSLNYPRCTCEKLIIEGLCSHRINLCIFKIRSDPDTCALEIYIYILYKKKVVSKLTSLGQIEWHGRKMERTNFRFPQRFSKSHSLLTFSLLSSPRIHRERLWLGEKD